MEETYEKEIWLTRQEAADWLKCSKGKIDSIVREMKERNFGGILTDTNFLRINQNALQQYIYKRRSLKKYDDKRYRHLN